MLLLSIEKFMEYVLVARKTKRDKKHNAASDNSTKNRNLSIQYAIRIRPIFYPNIY